MTEEQDQDWFAVRCIFSVGWPPDAVGSYEERITLWRASSIDEAIQQAESEAHAYADEIDDAPSAYLGLAQCFRLAEGPKTGSEIFSLIRRSELAPDEYLTSFFDTGSERQGQVE